MYELGVGGVGVLPDDWFFFFGLVFGAGLTNIN
jgi:hypothetical protein